MRLIPLLCLLLSTILFSCNKYLEKKPDKSLVVPTTLRDIQALLDNKFKMNHSSPDLLEALADNYYVTGTNYQAQALSDRLNYVWAPEAMSLISWQTTYQGPVYLSNVVLDQLPGVKGDAVQKNVLKGSALFHRAFAFYQLAQLYCLPYSSRAVTDPGIPLRLTAAIESPSVKSTVEQTYGQIVNDLKTAVTLLPDTVLSLTRPSKTAAYAALARTYLSMRDYTSAGFYANECLQAYDRLIDFNTLPVSNAPVKRFNAETIFYNVCESFNGMLYGGTGYIDTMLYRSYQDKDLRKSVFFRANTGAAAGSYRFKGSFDGEYYPQLVFDGLTSAEMWLIRGECAARSGDTETALYNLNTLMYHRWKNDGSWTPFVANSADEALLLILQERRKELVYRGLRWTDLRRLNQEGADATLTRIIQEETYLLPPRDHRWVALIPQEVIDRTGMAQNQR